jgi:capsular polysaccharide biosynthesis protein
MVDTRAERRTDGHAAGLPRTLPWDLLTPFSLRNLTLALIAAVGVGALTATLVLSTSPRYSSQATMVIDNPPELAAAADPGPFQKLSALRLKYAALVGTDAIAVPVGRKLGVSPGLVAGAASVSAPAQTLVMVSGATTGSPALSQRIAQGVAEELVSYVQQEHRANNVPPERRFRFIIVNPALRGAKVSPTRSRATIAAAIAGGVAVALAYIALQLITSRNRSRLR